MDLYNFLTVFWKLILKKGSFGVLKTIRWKKWHSGNQTVNQGFRNHEICPDSRGTMVNIQTLGDQGGKRLTMAGCRAVDISLDQVKNSAQFFEKLYWLEPHLLDGICQVRATWKKESVLIITWLTSGHFTPSTIQPTIEANQITAF